MGFLYVTVIKDKAEGSLHFSKLGSNDRLFQKNELVNQVAGLPSELVDDDQEAKQFDLLILRLQIGLLRREKSFVRWSNDGQRRHADMRRSRPSKEHPPGASSRLTSTGYPVLRNANGGQGRCF